MSITPPDLEERRQRAHEALTRLVEGGELENVSTGLLRLQQEGACPWPSPESYRQWRSRRQREADASGTLEEAAMFGDLLTISERCDARLQVVTRKDGDYLDKRDRKQRKARLRREAARLRLSIAEDECMLNSRTAFRENLSALHDRWNRDFDRHTIPARERRHRVGNISTSDLNSRRTLPFRSSSPDILEARLEEQRRDLSAILLKLYPTIPTDYGDLPDSPAIIEGDGECAMPETPIPAQKRHPSAPPTRALPASLSHRSAP